LALTAVRDLRELRDPATEDELADFETDVLSGSYSPEHPPDWSTPRSATT
jgi:hypothetical protein